jgi:hypothetical protein
MQQACAGIWKKKDISTVPLRVETREQYCEELKHAHCFTSIFNVNSLMPPFFTEINGRFLQCLQKLLHRFFRRFLMTFVFSGLNKSSKSSSWLAYAAIRDTVIILAPETDRGMLSTGDGGGSAPGAWWRRVARVLDGLFITSRRKKKKKNGRSAAVGLVNWSIGILLLCSGFSWSWGRFIDSVVAIHIYRQEIVSVWVTGEAKHWAVDAACISSGFHSNSQKNLRWG